MPTFPQLIEEDIGEINNALLDLLAKSDASIAFLIDKGGFVITQCGRVGDLDITTLAALSAASFAATESIASLVQERNFSSVYQQGENFSLLVVNVDEQSLLTVIFKATLSVGAVKYYSTDTIKVVAAQLRKAHQRTPDHGLDLSMLNLADPSPLFRRKAAGA
jgi:predicted regulator of Ras-like GTPase activity (Roadblock/LC7/MglB family)